MGLVLWIFPSWVFGNVETHGHASFLLIQDSKSRVKDLRVPGWLSVCGIRRMAMRLYLPVKVYGECGGVDSPSFLSVFGDVETHGHASFP